MYQYIPWIGGLSSLSGFCSITQRLLPIDSCSIKWLTLINSVSKANVMTSKLKLDCRPCKEIFPLEVWDCIIRNLTCSFTDLLTCRRVCRDWRETTDKVLQQSGLPWNPEFSRNTGEDEETFKEHMQGTRFNEASSITKFICFASDSNRSPQLGLNPFPLRSISIFPGSHEESDLYLKVPLLLSHFGDQVWHCTYYVNECMPQSVLALPAIFQMMPNLKSLTLLACGWARPGIEDGLRRLTISSMLKNLTQVNIFGEHAIIPLSILILPRHGNQLKQLYFFCDDDSDQVEKMQRKGYSYYIGSVLPNLESLKIFHPNSQLVSSLKDNCSMLKRLSMRSSIAQSDTDGNSIKLEELMGVLNSHAGTLRTLHLQMEPKNLVVINNDSDKEVINPNVIFPRLTSLNISYSLCTGSPFFEVIVSKLSSLEEIMFIICDVDAGSSETMDRSDEYEIISQDTFDGMCLPIWSLVPRSVQRMSVRNCWWDSENGIIRSEYVTCERKS